MGLHLQAQLQHKTGLKLHLQLEDRDQEKDQNYKMASWPSPGSILEASKPGVFVNLHRSEKVAHKKRLASREPN